MSRRSIIILACVTALLILAVTPWALPSGRLDRQVGRELADMFDIKAELSGRGTFALLPTPRIKFGEIRLLNAEGEELVRGAQFRGELRLDALLRGRIELAEVSLSGGTIMAEWGPGASRSWTEPLTHLAGRFGGDAGRLDLRRLVLTGMTVVATDRCSGSITELRSASLVVQLPGRQSDLELLGSAIWRGQVVELAATEIDPAALAAGRASPLSIRLKSHPLNASINGTLTWTDGPKLAGLFTADTASLQTAMTWQGFAAPGTRRPLSASGDVVATPSGIELPRLQAHLGSETVEGAVALQFSADRPSVRATLAADSLDLSPYLRRPDRRSSSRAIGVKDLVAIDLDLRLSASQASLGGGVGVTDLAIGLLTSSENVDLTLVRASLAGGTVRGRLTAGPGESGWGLRAQAGFNRIDLSKAPAAAASRLPSGIASGQLNGEAAGSSFDDLVRNVAGRATVTIDDGAVSGSALPSGIRSDTPTVVGADAPLPFRRIQVDAKLAPGSAELAQATLESALLRAEASGTVSLPDGTLALVVRTRPGAGTTASTRTLAVNGPWNNPSVASAAAASAVQR